MTPEERIESAMQYLQDRFEYHHEKYVIAQKEAGDPDTVSLGNEMMVRAQVSMHNTCMGMAAEAMKRLEGQAEPEPAPTPEPVPVQEEAPVGSPDDRIGRLELQMGQILAALQGRPAS